MSQVPRFDYKHSSAQGKHVRCVYNSSSGIGTQTTVKGTLFKFNPKGTFRTGDLIQKDDHLIINQTRIRAADIVSISICAKPTKAITIPANGIYIIQGTNQTLNSVAKHFKLQKSLIKTLNSHHGAKGKDVLKQGTEIYLTADAHKQWQDADDEDLEITQIKFITGNTFMYKDSGDPATEEQHEGVPPGLCQEWEEWARNHPGEWGPPNRALNGIKKLADGRYRVFYGKLGDTSDAQPRRSGFNSTTYDSWQQLTEDPELELQPDYADLVQKAAVGATVPPPTVALDSNDVQLKAGFARCVCTDAEPFGLKLPSELIHQAKGCAAMSVLVCMPPDLRKRVGADGLAMLRDNTEQVYQPPSSSAQASLLYCELAHAQRPFEDKEFREEYCEH